MKKILLLLLALPMALHAQDQNYIKTTTYKKSNTTSLLPTPPSDQAVQSVTYFDGLGRPIQQIAGKQSATGNDIVTHIEYDGFGRQAKDYLPYASDANTMAFIDPATARQATLQYYQDHFSDAQAFSEKRFEASPLNRVLQQAAPGLDWALGPQGQADHSVKTAYQTNTASDGVRLFKAAAQSATGGAFYPVSPSQDGTYLAGQLYKTVNKDENWVSGTDGTTEEFKDKEGRVVLKRTYASSDPHDTYYVYDQYGNLSCVMPPLSDKSASGNDLDGLCYQYRYDYRNRLVEKKLPGKDWEFIIYDRLDRVVATGPALNPFGTGTKGWLFTKYDAFNRPVYNGWYSGHGATSADRTTIQTALNTSSVLSESRTTPSNINNVQIAYTNDAFPKISILLLGISYYDDYGFPGVAPVPTAVFGEPILGNVKGLSTGSWTRVLTTASQYVGEQSTVFYDTKARPVRSYLKNYLGGYTQSDSRIDFSGKTLYTVTEHKRTANVTLTTIREDFTYTDQDRLLAHTHKINSNPAELLAKNEYDELGQLVLKSVGRTENDPLQKVDYTYNIRGWLLGINDITDLKPATENDLFAYKVGYNETDDVAGYSGTRLYNGNISETYWKTKSDVSVRKYAYKYDGLNRLGEAVYQRPLPSIPHPDCYGESLSYDKNGNIQTLTRYGNREATDYAQLIDALEYTYHPDKKNQLMQVYDSTLQPVGFSDGNNGNNTDYAYDEFGNMTGDANKGIDLISYNHLNLPVKIAFSNGAKIEYLYRADGTKVQKKVFFLAPSLAGGLGSSAMDYLGGFQYQDNVLKHFPTAEGYVSHVSGSYQYVFNYTDHLGNIRLSFGWDMAEGKLKIMEENHYYPFGLKHANYNTHTLGAMKKEEGIVMTLKAMAAPSTPKPVMGYNYKFLGQERQDELGLNWDTFRYRNYDFAIGRFMGIDPITEEYMSISPYQFAHNNPVWKIELEGLEGKPTSGTDVINREPRVLAVFYHGGPDGNGAIQKSTANTGGTGARYNATAAYAQSQGKEFKGAVIAPAATQELGVQAGADFLNANYQAGDQVIIYGYSYGGDNAVNLAEAVPNIQIDGLITVDSSDGPLRGLTVDTSVPDNVTTAFNFFQTNASGNSSASGSSGNSDNPNSSENSSSDGSSNLPGSRGFPHTSEGKAKVNNIQVTGGNVSHGNIQTTAAQNIQKRINEVINGN